MKSVYCAVRTGSLNKAVLRFVFKGLIIAEKAIQILDVFLQNQAILYFIWISETADNRYVSEGACRSIEH
jgi:hypothetical protein